MLWSPCLGVRVMWNQLSASTCSILKNSLVKEHKAAEELFQAWMNRVFCSSGPLTSGTKPKRSADCLQTSTLQWIFPLGRHNAAYGFLFFTACQCSFLFQQEFKKFNIISSCLTLSFSIMLSNHCSYQQRNCEIKIIWLSCIQCFQKTVCSSICTIFCTSA